MAYGMRLAKGLALMVSVLLAVGCGDDKQQPSEAAESPPPPAAQSGPTAAEIEECIRQSTNALNVFSTNALGSTQIVATWTTPIENTAGVDLMATPQQAEELANALRTGGGGIGTPTSHEVIAVVGNAVLTWVERPNDIAEDDRAVRACISRGPASSQ